MPGSLAIEASCGQQRPLQCQRAYCALLSAGLALASGSVIREYLEGGGAFPGHLATACRMAFQPATCFDGGAFPGDDPSLSVPHEPVKPNSEVSGTRVKPTTYSPPGRERVLAGVPR
jgi:hypothetical protein